MTVSSQFLNITWVNIYGPGEKKDSANAKKNNEGNSFLSPQSQDTDITNYCPHKKLEYLGL
jgi:hypothetical protein